MQFRYYSVVMVAFVAGLAVYGYFTAVPSAPTKGKKVIRVRPEEYDFGRIQYGEAVETEFRLENRGSQKLEIRKTTTSCGCTTARLATETLKPGETAALTVTYESEEMPRKHGVGEQERFIYIYNDTPDSPLVTRRIHGYVGG